MEDADDNASVSRLHSLLDACSASFPSTKASAPPPSSPRLQMSQTPTTNFPPLTLSPHSQDTIHTTSDGLILSWKNHRRSSSDVPLGFSAMIQSSPQLIPISSQGLLAPLTGVQPIDPVKKELNPDNAEGEVVDEFLASRINCQAGSCEKRSAPAVASVAVRHFRSFSMDSFMGDLSIAEKSSTDGKFSLEFGNGEFTGAELKKIMASEKLSEIAVSDPKRAKRILANRLSAARSKERKMKYISELEHMVQTLQAESTTLYTQLTLLQRESAGLASQNSELTLRLQAMQQQAQLKEALNEALTAEVERLKLIVGDRRGDVRASNCPMSQ